jgi:hypothetical protein
MGEANMTILADQTLPSTAEIITDHEPELVGDTINYPSISPNTPEQLPTAQELATLILQCSTWVEIAQRVGEDGSSLLAATKTMSQEERSELPRLLAAHLCQDPTYLSKLLWVPVKLRDRALEQLTFTIQRIGGVTSNASDACLESIEGCKFLTVANLGTRYEQWIFQTPSGVKATSFWGRSNNSDRTSH